MIEEIVNLAEIYMCMFSEENQMRIKKALVKASINLEGSKTCLTMLRVKEILKTSERPLDQ